MAVHNDHDRLTQLQEEILAALPEDKKELVDAAQDAFMEMVMDEGEAAFAEGVRLGVRLEMLGKNQYNNDYNHAYRKMGVNCWIGMLADGTVTTIQTLPWDYRPWGCGSGKNGSCNNGWLQFEICMGRKTDKEYFDAAYREACEITAYLCCLFGFDPYGTVDFKGMKVPVILCHADSHKLGLGSNHGDIYSYFGLFGKDMDTFRADVAALLADTHEAAPVDAALPAGDEKEQEDDVMPNEVYVGDLLTEKRIWERLFAVIPNAYAVAGIMGNMMAESGLRSNNLQGSKEKTLDMTDEQYTAAVDDGSYTNFVHDGAGYGLFQATYWSIKEGLLSFAREKGVSISDCQNPLAVFLIVGCRAPKMRAIACSIFSFMKKAVPIVRQNLHDLPKKLEAEAGASGKVD